MRVLVVINDSSRSALYLIDLADREHIQIIKNLIHDRRHSEAITTVMSKGRFERVVAHEEIHDLDADLILTQTAARWDVTRR
jgi:hypothetical protein